MARSTTTHRTTDSTPAADKATAETAGPTVELLDPAALLTDVNVRHEARLDPAFVASIKEHGVLVPIVAVRTAEGGVRVRFGHRRTLAAIEAGRPVVPVVIVADEATDTAAQVERIVGQWAENEHRTGLTVAERIDAMAQLSAFGVSAAQIAKRTKAPRREVDAALAVAASDLAKAATARYDFLDLAMASVIADFESDTEAVKALVAAAKEGRFDHVAQRLRDDRAEQQRRAELEAELTAAGVAVIATPRHGDTTRPLAHLDDADGNPLTAEGHRDCPGHAAFVASLQGYLDPATRQPVYEDDTALINALHDDLDEDYEDEDPADAEPMDAAEAPRTVWGSYLAVRYACTDPTAHGHRDRWGSGRAAEPKRRAQDMDDHEREAARAERREVIECNKNWGSSTSVRLDWLKSFAARKTAPKGTAAFIAAALATDPDLLNGIGGNTLAAELLGCAANPGYGRNAALRELAAQAGEARALVIALVQVLAAYEDRTDRDDWRHVRGHTTRYLTYLAACGYGLSEVEQRASGATSEQD